MIPFISKKTNIFIENAYEKLKNEKTQFLCRLELNKIYKGKPRFSWTKYMTETELMKN